MESKNKKRSEKEGLLNFSKEMVSSLLMALIFIIYIIQAFRIPTGSMERSLLAGDFLLGLKFVYGAPVLPFSYAKFPRLKTPQPGDVVIFEYPGLDTKDYIKRCVAGPGQTIQIDGTQVKVDGKVLALPPKGQYTKQGQLGVELIEHFEPYTIPRASDTLLLDSLSLRDLLFAKNIIKQEHPRPRLVKFAQSAPILRSFFSRKLENERVKLRYELRVDGELAPETEINLAPVFPFSGQFIALNNIAELTTIDMAHNLQNLVMTLQSLIQKQYPDRDIRIQLGVLLDGKPVEQYVVKNDNYFMMGDNRDNSADSRFWGVLNQKFVKAQAFILYFSLDQQTPYVLLPLKIRWERIGKLIRSWDGQDPPDHGV